MNQNIQSCAKNVIMKFMGNVNKITINFKKIWGELLKRLTTADKILIFCVLLLFFLTSYHFLRGKSHKIAVLYYEDEIIGEFRLSENQKIIISEGISAEILDGKVYMVESTCKNQICVTQGSSNLTPIICAPNRIALVIRSLDREKLLITR